MNRYRICPLLFLFSAVTQNLVQAQWIPTGGPGTASVTSFAMAPGGPASQGAEVFAGTNGGVFSTTDRGLDWTQRGAGQIIQPVFGLTYTEAGGGWLYAATFGSGILRSSDRGLTWNGGGTGFLNQNATSIVTLPASGGAGTPKLMAGTDGGGIFMSTDGGQTWSEANAGLTDLHVSALAPVPSLGPDYVLAGTFGAGVFLSSNGGSTWNSKSVSPVEYLVTSLCVAKDSSHTTVFSGTYIGEVFASTDGGETWTGSGVDPSGSPVMALVSVAAPDSTSPATLVAATDGAGLFLSLDHAESWLPVNTGLTTKRTLSLGAIPDSGSARGFTLFAGTNAGAFRSRNLGSTWSFLSRGIVSAAVSSLAVVDRSTYVELYAGLYGDGVYTMITISGAWFRSAGGLTDPLVYAMHSVVGQNGPLTPNLFAGTGGSGACISTNLGSSWTQLATPGASVFYSFASSGTGRVYAATDAGVSISTNSGTSWLPSGSGLAGLPALAVTVAPGSGSTPDRVFAGTSGGGVFASSDSGATWNAANNGLTDTLVNALIAVPSAGSVTLYAGTKNRIFVSTNDGGTWNTAGTGLPEAAVRSFVASGSTVIAATSLGVFATHNDGVNWSDVSAGLLNRNVTSLAISGTTLLVGTLGSGVWQRLLADVLSVDGYNTATVPLEFSLGQNYPNPFNPSTTITYTLPESGPVVLRVVNVLGEEIAVLVDGFQRAGSYKVRFDAGAIPSGVYFTALTAGRHHAAGRMILLK